MSELVLPNFEFRTVQDETDARRAGNFLARHPEHYEDTNPLAWLQEKMVPRLSSGDAYGVTAYVDRLEVVGFAGIYIDPAARTVECKVFRSGVGYGDQGVGTFNFRLMEVLGCRILGLQESDEATLVLDTRETNIEARHFFEKRGCVAVGRTALYTPGIYDIQYAKTIRPPRAGRP